MHHFIGQLSLISGWLPIATQVVTLVGVGAAVGRRAHHGAARWLPVALLIGLAVALAVDIYIGAIGVAGGPVPPLLLWWVVLIGLSGVTAAAGWRGARWWRRGVAAVSVPACVLCAALALNQWVGYFPTVHTSWNQLTVGPLPDQIDRLAVTVM